MCASNFVATNESTEQSTAFPTMVADRTTERCHPNRIRQGQEQEEQQDGSPFVVGIPDAQTFRLECGNMSKPRKQERLDIPWGVWTRNDTTGDNIANLVVLVWPQVKNNPDVYPAIRLFVLIKLCAVNREHKNGVILSNSTILNSTQVSISG